MKAFSTTVFALATLAAAVLTGCSDSGKTEEPSGKALVSRKAIAEKKREAFRKRAAEKAVRTKARREPSREIIEVSNEKEDERWLAERGKQIEKILREARAIIDYEAYKAGKLSRPSALRQLLDSGNRKLTLALAREMRYSGRRSDRAAAGEAFGWLGTEALSDLTGMLADPDPEIAADAMTDWSQSLSDVEDEGLRCELIKEAANNFESDESMESILMELVTVEDYRAVLTLDEIINGGAPDATKEVARDVYSHLGGEDYVNSGEAHALAARLKAEGEEISTDRLKQVQDALKAVAEAKATKGGEVKK